MAELADPAWAWWWEGQVVTVRFRSRDAGTLVGTASEEGKLVRLQTDSGTYLIPYTSIDWIKVNT